ncbi:hypothetical protein [Paenibacillus sp. FSL E2-0201]
MTDTPSGFSGDDAGRMVQELQEGQYSTTLDFTKAYKKHGIKPGNRPTNNLTPLGSGPGMDWREVQTESDNIREYKS